MEITPKGFQNEEEGCFFREEQADALKAGGSRQRAAAAWRQLCGSPAEAGGAFRPGGGPAGSAVQSENQNLAEPFASGWALDVSYIMILASLRSGLVEFGRGRRPIIIAGTQ